MLAEALHVAAAAATTTTTTATQARASAARQAANPYIGWIVLALLAFFGWKAWGRLRGARGRLEAKIRNQVEASAAARAGAGAGARSDVGGINVNLSIGTDERGQLVVLQGDRPATTADLPGAVDLPILAGATVPSLALPEQPGVRPAGSGGRVGDAVGDAPRSRPARVPRGRRSDGGAPEVVTREAVL